MNNKETIKDINVMLFGEKAFNRFTREERHTLEKAKEALEAQDEIEKMFVRQKNRMKEVRFLTHYNIGRLEALAEATGRENVWEGRE